MRVDLALEFVRAEGIEAIGEVGDPDPYIATILYLEPTYGPVYRFADTLLFYHPIHATEEDARKARAILERGTKERAWDYEIWLEYGQFCAFLAPMALTSATEKREKLPGRANEIAAKMSRDLIEPHFQTTWQPAAASTRISAASAAMRDAFVSLMKVE